MSYSYSVPGFEVWEFLPRDQSLENWRDMITAQAISRDDSNPPRALLGLVTERAHRLCLEVLSSPIDEQAADGLPAATMTQFCLRNAQARRGDVTLYRAIDGTDTLYVLSRTRRDEAYDGRTIPLSEPALARWKEDLGGYRICRQGNDCGPP